MDLLVAVDDYCVTKVAVAASVAGVKINVVKGISHEELALLDVTSKSMVLRTSSGIITQHVAMLRYIAEMVPALQLVGVTAFDTALVDQWLDFSWCELGTLQSEDPLQMSPRALIISGHALLFKNVSLSLDPSPNKTHELLQQRCLCSFCKSFAHLTAA